MSAIEEWARCYLGVSRFLQVASIDREAWGGIAMPRCRTWPTNHDQGPINKAALGCLAAPPLDCNSIKDSQTDRLTAAAVALPSDEIFIKTLQPESFPTQILFKSQIEFGALHVGNRGMFGCYS